MMLSFRAAAEAPPVINDDMEIKMAMRHHVEVQPIKPPPDAARTILTADTNHKNPVVASACSNYQV